MNATVYISAFAVKEDDQGPQWKEKSATLDKFLYQHPQLSCSILDNAYRVVRSIFETEDWLDLNDLSYEIKNNCFVVELETVGEGKKLSPEEIEEKVRELIDNGADTYMEGDIALLPDNGDYDDEQAELYLEVDDVDIE